jgi:hypothetical protein
MNPLLELFLKNGLPLDVAGLLGLGLIALAAVKLARRDRSWGGNLMAVGAVFLVIARLYFITAPYFMTDDFIIAIGPVGLSATYALPPLLLTFGLAGIVWGLWSHERWLQSGNH